MLSDGNCELFGVGAAGKIERQSATLGSHHQTGKFDVALSAGGSGAGHGAQCAGMAEPQSELVIMIAVADRRDGWVGPSS